MPLSFRRPDYRLLGLGTVHRQLGTQGIPERPLEHSTGILPAWVIVLTRLSAHDNRHNSDRTHLHPPAVVIVGLC